MRQLLESLTARVRGEFREMPGLRLTFKQACRLWQLDPPTCESVLQLLVDEGFLMRTPDGGFIAGPTELRMQPASPGSTPLKRGAA